MNKEEEYKKKIAENLDNVLESGHIPELGEPKKGKVRDVYFKDDKVIMVASDRVSAFDRVLPRCVPYKGYVLNLFNIWAMENARYIMQTAFESGPDPNVIVQKSCQNSSFEWVVRGHVWGGLAADYEAGKRIKCGITFPEGLIRYQKLDRPVVTPTTKAEKGHDEDVSLEDIAEKLGEARTKKLGDLSKLLFQRGEELAQRAGMLLLDTKFEFGYDSESLAVYLIDESLTPDSSRYCGKEDYEQKFPMIVALMKEGKWANVSELLKEHPEYKIKEESKQYLRDILLEAGYKEGSPMPELNDEQVIETSYRYIVAYEKLTGRQFDFAESELPPKKRIMNNLVKAGLAYGGCVIPIGASTSDKEHWEKIEKALKAIKVPYTKPLYASAHKETQKVLDYVADMDTRTIEPIVYLTFAGRSNGLGPVVAGNTKYPVITCPVFSDLSAYLVDIHSSLRMPGNLPLMTIIDPGNAALAAKRILDLSR